MQRELTQGHIRGCAVILAAPRQCPAGIGGMPTVKLGEQGRLARAGRGKDRCRLEATWRAFDQVAQLGQLALAADEG